MRSRAGGAASDALRTQLLHAVPRRPPRAAPSESESLSSRTTSSGDVFPLQIPCPQTGCGRQLHQPDWHVDNIPPNSALAAQIEKEKEERVLRAPLECKKHSIKKEAFCDTCRTQICMMCLDDHRKHDILYLESAVKQYGTLCSEKRERNENLQQKIAGEIKKEKEEVKNTKKSAKEKIEAVFKSVRLALEDAEAAAVVQILQGESDAGRQAHLAALETGPNRLGLLDRVLAAALDDPPHDAAVINAALAAAEADRETGRLERLLEFPQLRSSAPSVSSLDIATRYLQEVRKRLSGVKYFRQRPLCLFSRL